MPTPPLDDWLVREILVHEAPLVRFLGRCWPHRDEVADDISWFDTEGCSYYLQFTHRFGGGAL